MTILRSHYRIILVVALTIALIDLLLFLPTIFYRFDAAVTEFLKFTIATSILIGLFVRSNLARYLGGAWYLLAALTFLLPAISGSVSSSVLLFIFVVAGALHISGACLLFFSKQFAIDFARERETQPSYKRTLGRMVIIALIAIVTIVTLIDLVHLLPKGNPLRDELRM